tara:strand:+ start:628 stop:963 length:336 start_codon:yes stop_codon:yes gene_type:complete
VVAAETETGRVVLQLAVLVIGLLKSGLMLEAMQFRAETEAVVVAVALAQQVKTEQLQNLVMAGLGQTSIVLGLQSLQRAFQDITLAVAVAHLIITLTKQVLVAQAGAVQVL